MGIFSNAMMSDDSNIMQNTLLLERMHYLSCIYMDHMSSNECHASRKICM